MDFRIGINLGDVVVKDEVIYGDGVNVAARLESLAEPGGICISRPVFDQVESKLNLDCEYLGEQQVKNIAKPVRAYRVLLDGVAAPAGEAPEVQRGIDAGDSGLKPKLPTLIVLPFQNLSDDREQAYFSDGVSEDLITDLSKISRLSVISRNTAFTYKGRAVNVRDLGRELGVDYVLEGSVRRAGDRLRITAQLIDAKTDNHLWSERYDRKWDDLFDWQDEITRDIVTALDVQLLEGEQARIWRKSTKSPKAYDLFLKGLDIARNGSGTQANEQAMQLLEQAIDVDPNFAEAYAALARRHIEEGLFGDQSQSASLEKVRELASKAMELNDEVADAYTALGMYYLLKGDTARAVAEAEQGVRLSPQSADATARLAQIQLFSGDPALAVATFRRAMTLAPSYPSWYATFLGHAFYCLERHKEAVEVLRESVAIVPNAIMAHVFLAANQMALKNVAEGEAAAKEILRIHPAFSVGQWSSGLSGLGMGKNIKPFLDHLRHAGLPD
ncbi:MAG: hypothetical protein O7C61_07470 [SAR324 cluster bacterium]|nr:hypothetical protein [SAR324 cluster bacterium]